jgi:hypothetical protein
MSDDQRLWLMNKLAEYESAANLEMWEAARDRLNTAWAPLAERRITATQKLGECTALLLAAIDDLKAIHDAQRNLLVAFTPTDKLKPKGYCWRIRMSTSRLCHCWRCGCLQHRCEARVTCLRFWTLLPPSQQTHQIHGDSRQHVLQVCFGQPAIAGLAQTSP